MLTSSIKKKFLIHVTSSNADHCEHLRSILESDTFAITTEVSDALPGMKKNEGTDLHIICLHEEFQPVDDSPSRRSQLNAPAFFISDNKSDEMRLWAFRHGATDYIVKPFSSTEFKMRVERLLLLNKKNFKEHITEERILKFLKTMLDNNTKTIEPALEPFFRIGHFYPEVAKSFAKTGNDVELLEKLAEEGLLDREIFNRIRQCPVCNDHHLNYRETCPKCSSLDIEQKEIIHHFSCGHMNTLEAYRKGPDLICPKCNEKLRHIGLDYEKAAKHFHCNSCQFIFAEPKVEMQCVWCGYLGDPEETVEKIVYRYYINSMAEEAVANQQIKGVNLASILLNKHTGLYSRSYFEHELQRELVRSNRYGYALSVIFVRINKLDKVKAEHFAKTAEYITSIFHALTKDLRTLDTYSILDEDIIGIILSGTNSENAKIVAERMNENVNSLEYLFDIGKPEIAFSLLASDKQHRYKSFQEIIKEGIGELK